MKPARDPYTLQRFVDAQRAVYDQAVTELRAGRKESHWMWYIFPQIEGLGHSAMAQKYAISSVAEATEYLNHPELGKRLRDVPGSLPPSTAAPFRTSSAIRTI